MLRWGNEIYLPVYNGMQFGIGIYNGARTYTAYPVYIEAKNIWDGGPAQPENCTTDHMWEVQPGQSMVMDKLVNPNAQRGRPLIITEAGFGHTVGEATFGTNEFRGQIRVYQRNRIGGGLQNYRPTNQGTGALSLSGGVQESFTMGGELGNLAPQPKDRDIENGRAGIGAGAETHQAHHETYMSYQRRAEPVIFLRVEYRSDLLPLLRIAWNFDWQWYEDYPVQTQWWTLPWSWGPTTAPEIPVTPSGPHRPRR